MDPHSQADAILAQAQVFGASLAGIADVASLKASPSFEIYDKLSRYGGDERGVWPAHAGSVLVLALVHDPSEPRLDWWGQMVGGTWGNRALMRVSKRLARWAKQEWGIGARPLPYGVEQGGVFLKDAAALAGLGIIGKNNLLVTPEFGPRVRLRALFLGVALTPGGPIDFDPCKGCDMPCWRACPKHAFRDGSYHRPLCREQMNEDQANRTLVEDWADGAPAQVVQYCRACELACPVARS
ncbi:MAG: epoxyqueuosine reductase [Anaerolineae bacterium]|jgi:epoxyqueuosine reductase